MRNTTSAPKIYTDYQKISYKDIELLLVSVSEKTAQQYLRDIKKEFQISIVLFSHFKHYFKITEIVPKN
ncbi:hypothetical protein [Flavobacterium xinjiangense]|uniref:Uncharacterized protein n=1 Tax=Flavobacterium xinjiangense TaxID=178356 RepID=A0A1M7L2N5_9FLAO|nr:hypothetical protein [Flavobacterium xinjiangense]SHM72113.1 hypothetical protein SAMN05216269_106162 [Flavobacterium xinjiangense]